MSQPTMILSANARCARSVNCRNSSTTAIESLRCGAPDSGAGQATRGRNPCRGCWQAPGDPELRSTAAAIPPAWRLSTTWLSPTAMRRTAPSNSGIPASSRQVSARTVARASLLSGARSGWLQIRGWMIRGPLHAEPAIAISIPTGSSSRPSDRAITAVRQDNPIFRAPRPPFPSTGLTNRSRSSSASECKSVHAVFPDDREDGHRGDGVRFTPARELGLVGELRLRRFHVLEKRGNPILALAALDEASRLALHRMPVKLVDIIPGRKHSGLHIEPDLIAELRDDRSSDSASGSSRRCGR